MRRRVAHIPGVLLLAGVAALSAWQANVVGAVAFGAMALLLVWFGLRPEPEDAATRPWRTMVVGARPLEPHGRGP